MALKADAQNPLDYLNQMLKDSGLEIVIPDDKKEEKKEKKDNEKKTNDKKD